MITSVQIKNLRSLRDTGMVGIKPITILVGANSSGKSTFLRSFPLLTQSVIKSLRGSISWFDDSYVDFGDFNTAKCKFVGDDKCIEFHYQIEKLPILSYRKYGGFRGMPYITPPQKYKTMIDRMVISLFFTDDGRGTYINKIVIVAGELTFEFGIPKREVKAWVKINGEEIKLKSDFIFHFSDSQSLLPWLFPNSSNSANLEYVDDLKEDIQKFVLSKSDNRTKRLDRANFVFDLWECDTLSFLNKLVNNNSLPSFKKHTQKWNTKNEEFLQLYNYLALYHILCLYPSIDREIVGMYRNCSYIAPARAEASRYYRTQGLQINDIDAYGRNMPEFIASLSSQALDSYNNYTKKIVGVKVKKENNSGHQSIVLETDNGKYNMADVGFGYSQILPIVTKLWFYKYSPSKFLDSWRMSKAKNTVTMEQPELHLHPAYQAMIADAFIDFVYEKDENGNLKSNSPRLIIETHSETIINRIGRRIREGKLPSDLVNVVLFDKGVNDKETRVSQTVYNKNGQLENWPIGFFDPID